MAGNFNLPFGVRVSTNKPLDADRYIATDISARDSLIIANRAFNGLQVYVESNKTLYLLEDITVPTWREITTNSSSIESSPTEIIFNSGGTLTGNSNLTYDYDNSIFKVSDVKSEFNIKNSYDDTPTISLKSNFIDGIELDIATNMPGGGALSTIRSKGNQISKSNVTNNTYLFTYDHSGWYENSAITTVQINMKSVEDWSSTSYATEYKISTISSGNTTLDERFLINGLGEIRFNNAYTFPTISGTSGQVLTQSGNGYLYWDDITTTSTLSGLTDTIINNPQDGDKLIYSGGSWINVDDADQIFSHKISCDENVAIWK